MSPDLSVSNVSRMTAISAMFSRMHRYYGLMVDENDASTVSDAVVGLLKDPARRQAMGAAGRERMLAEFTWARVGEQYINLLNAVVHS